MSNPEERIKKLEGLVVKAQTEIERLDKELDEIKSNWQVEQLNHADTLLRLEALQGAVGGFLNNTGNVIENKWLQGLREALPKSNERENEL